MSQKLGKAKKLKFGSQRQGRYIRLRADAETGDNRKFDKGVLLKIVETDGKKLGCVDEKAREIVFNASDKRIRLIQLSEEMDGDEIAGWVTQFETSLAEAQEKKRLEQLKKQVSNLPEDQLKASVE